MCGRRAGGLSGGAPGDAGTAGVWLHSEGREGEAPELREEKNRLYQREVPGWEPRGDKGYLLGAAQASGLVLGNGSCCPVISGKAPPRRVTDY